jgi:hypothetical protein
MFPPLAARRLLLLFLLTTAGRIKMRAKKHRALRRVCRPGVAEEEDYKHQTAASKSASASDGKFIIVTVNTNNTADTTHIVGTKIFGPELSANVLPRYTSTAATHTEKINPNHFRNTERRLNNFIKSSLYPRPKPKACYS